MDPANIQPDVIPVITVLTGSDELMARPSGGEPSRITASNARAFLKGDPGADGAQGIQGVQGPAGVGVLTAKNAGNQSNLTVTPADITGLTVALTSGRRYMIHAELLFQTAATTTGIGFNLTGPAVTSCIWTARIQTAAAGTDQFYETTATALATAAISPAVVAANTTYRASIDGVITPSAGGTLGIQFRSEVAASQVTILNGSAMSVIDCG